MSDTRHSALNYRAALESLICSPETPLNLLLDSAITYLPANANEAVSRSCQSVNHLAPSIPIPARVCAQGRFCCYLFAIAYYNFNFY